MYNFLIAGTIWFWIGIVAWFIIFISVIQDREGTTNLGTPLFVLVLGSAALWFFSKEFALQLWHSISIKALLIWTGIYIVIGLAWSFFRWWKFVGIAAKKWNDQKANYIETYGVERAAQKKKDSIPLASENKAQISSWIVFWPISAIRWILGDLINDLLEALQNVFGKVYTRIALSRFKD